MPGWRAVHGLVTIPPNRHQLYIIRAYGSNDLCIFLIEINHFTTVCLMNSIPRKGLKREARAQPENGAIEYQSIDVAVAIAEARPQFK